MIILREGYLDGELFSNFMTRNLCRKPFNKITVGEFQTITFSRAALNGLSINGACKIDIDSVAFFSSTVND